MGYPDAKRLQAIGDEICQIQADGRWDEVQFRRLFEEGKAAANGMPGATEFILKAATDWAWVEGLEESQRP